MDLEIIKDKEIVVPLRPTFLDFGFTIELSEEDINTDASLNAPSL